MKLERFFEKFEQFADAPNAVAKMRELILESAIRGSLVPHNASDEPASALLKRTETSRTSSAQAGKVRKQAPLPPVGDDAYLQIPLGWEWARLGNTGRIFNGDSVSESGKAALAKVENGLPFIATKDIGYGRDTLVYENGLKVPLGDSRFKVARAKAVLICAEGGSAGRKIGITDRDICFGNKLYANEVWEGVHHRYIFYVYQAPSFFREFAARMTGIIGGIARSEFLSLPIPLPPEEEQKRIVAKVDELMALCDRLEAQQLERDTRHAALARASLARFAEAPTPANLDFLFHQTYTITPADLRKSILTLTVQGKLVPQDPKEGVAAHEIGRIQERKEELIRDKLIKTAEVGLAVDREEVDHDIPDSWTWVRLVDICELITDGTHQTPKYTEAGRMFLSAQNVKPFKFMPEKHRFVSEEHYQGYIKNWKPEKGDVLLTRVGAGIGEAATIDQDLDFAIYVSVGLIRPVRGFVFSDYITLWLNSPDGTAKSSRHTYGKGVSQGNLNLSLIRNFLVPLPPLSEQHRIVAKVDQLMALVDQMETQLAVAKSKSAALLEAIVHELLNPSAEVIDLASYRSAIGCYTISKMSDKPYFGRTTAVKSLYLAEAHVGMRLGFQHERKAAGPLDLWIYRFEDEGKQKAWFNVVDNTSNGKMKMEYQPGKMLAAQAAQAESHLAPEQRKEFDRLLDLLSDKKTEEVEIIATLFAAWNDFLLDGHAPSDDKIVTEVRENWHVKKERFTPAQLRQWLGWLRQNNLVPQGRLPHTVHQSKLSLS